MDFKRQYQDESPYYRIILNIVSTVIQLFARVHVHQKGRENIPQNGSFLLVCNHRSKFDPILTWLSLKKHKLVYISKPENFKIPVFGKVIHRLRFIEIDRTSMAGSAGALRRGTEILKKGGSSVAVYPEGTRSLDCNLLPFHAVVFSMASHAKVPVLVMSIRGTEQINKNFPWKGSHVYIDFIECIPPEWIAQNGSRKLCARAEKAIRESLVSAD
ncbi:MAG: 1-acyl-sn-glycerol-3-phosphate acyltransferase [Treponema sp.]|nr:1-acyl-sn-glycerol-3-phosphate acyltransferase [Treponema sp.]